MHCYKSYSMHITENTVQSIEFQMTIYWLQKKKNTELDHVLESLEKDLNSVN